MNKEEKREYFLNNILNTKVYLGDSVYAYHDGYHLVLETSNGYDDDPRNKISLEPIVYENLINFRNHIIDSHEKLILNVKNEDE